MSYRVIYADPPWHYDDRQTNRPPSYRRMKYYQLADLDVGRLADADSMCFMWVTCPMLDIGVRLMGDWGFCYKTVAFVWVKMRLDGSRPVMGMGHYTRSNAEICLLGTRGSPAVRSHGVSQIILAPRGAHSAKPAVTRDRIVELAGNVPRLELFARGALPPGWHGHGDEFEGRAVAL